MENLLNEMERKLVEGKEIPTELLERYVYYRLQRELINAELFRIIAEYGKPQGVSLFHRIGYAFTKSKLEENREALMKLSKMLRYESAFLSKSIAVYRYTMQKRQEVGTFKWKFQTGD